MVNIVFMMMSRGMRKENGWIPVSKSCRKDGAYIVTFKNGIRGIGRIRLLQKNGAGISNRSWLVQFGNSTILCR